MKPAFLLLISALALPAQESVKNAVVEGTVVDAITGAPIEGVKVELSNRNRKHNYNLETDAKGIFFYDNVAPGDYVPVVRKDGFVFSKAGIAGGGIPFHVEAGDEPVRPRFELIPPGRLRGRVIGPDGKPAGGVEVALGPSYSLTTQKTADDGSFVFEKVGAGSHSLVAGDERSRTYFPAATDPVLAEQIEMAPGVDQGGYEIRLQTAVVHRVRGRVLDATGRPVPKTSVELIAPVARAETLGLSANGVTDFLLQNRPPGVTPAAEKPVMTDDNGVFEFPSVREGDWFLAAGRAGQSALVNLHKDLDDVTIRLDAPFELSGRVVANNGNAPPAPAVVAHLIPATGRISSLTLAGKDGELRFRNLTACLYHIRASAFANYYVSSIIVGEADATDQPVSLTPASGEIRIVIKPGATISGRTEKGVGAMVLAIPQSLAEGSMGKLQVAGPDGRFQFAGLVPGDYYVIAMNDFDGPSMLNIERLREIVRDAAAVHVDGGGAASIALK